MSNKTIRGFTIVELLIVIVVIGILAAITVTAYVNVQRSAGAAAAKSTQAQIAKTIETFKVQGDVYPTSISDCPTPAAANICMQAKPGQTLSYFAFGSGVPPRFSAALHSPAPAYELSVMEPNGFYYASNAEIASTNEFVQYMDMAPIINKYGIRPYKISFDIKSASTATSNAVNVYMQNGSDFRYSFGVNVTVSTNYERKSVTVTPSGPNTAVVQSILAFYGTYSTGNRPTIRNLTIEAG